MNYTQFMAIMRARWKRVALVFGITVALVVVISLVLPKKYTAEATVVVDVAPDPISGVATGAMMGPVIIATQVDVITSDRVTRRVIRSLKLAENPVIVQQWKDDGNGLGTVEDWLVEFFQKQIDVKPSHDSNVITIAYKAPDPNFAAAVANAFVKAYLDTAVELRVDPARQYSGFFDRRTVDARAALQSAQSRLSAYQQANGITADDERLDVETARLNDLSAQLVMMQALATDSSGRNSQAASGHSAGLADAMNSPVIGGLKVDLSRAEANLQQLSEHLGPNNPQILQAKANIQELRNRIDIETRNVAGSVGVSANINNSRVADLQGQLDKQRLKVLKLKQTRDGMTTLLSDVDSAQKTMDAILQRRVESNLESQTSQTNVNVLSPAVPPIKPSSPRILLNTLASIFLGGILAVGLTLWREMRDRRVRAAQDLLDTLGLAVLGVLPRPMSSKKGGLPSLMAQRVISGRLAAPSKN